MAIKVNSCLIWGVTYFASGVFYSENGMYIMSRSSRAGNGYQIHQALLSSSIPPLSPDEKIRLTSWLVSQRIQGVGIPEITQSVLDFVKSTRPLQVHERADRLLKHLAEKSTTAGQVLEIGTEGDRDSYGGWVPGKSPTIWASMAWSESSSWEEVRFFLGYLKEQGFIATKEIGSSWAIVNVTINGYSHIAEVSASRDLTQAFVAMWFDNSMDAVFDNGVEPAIKGAGYCAFRIDRKPDLDKIDDEIIAEIRRSRFLVADFTQGEDGARGGVYFEAGFAHGLRIPVIYTCRSDMVDKLHFDTRQYAHIVWNTPEELRDGLKNRIMARLGEGPGLQSNP